MLIYPPTTREITLNLPSTPSASPRHGLNEVSCGIRRLAHQKKKRWSEGDEIKSQ